jgi:ABC-2 type transport system ATP-binding protein
MALIEVSHLTKRFRSRERSAGLRASMAALLAPRYREREAVKALSFTLEAGETLAFIGPNGAGKSTTIKMLTGILFPTSGQARVMGYVPWKQRTQLAYHIASVFGQKSQLWYHLPPQDTFNLLAHIYELDMQAYRKRRDFLIEVFDIAAFLRTPARKLSLGERMRCELAAAFLHQPRIVFLDEPTIGLDIIAKQRIRELISYLNSEEQVTVFLTSHDAGDIEQVCQRAIVINDGQIILDTAVADLKHQYLKTKTVELLLQERTETIVQRDKKAAHLALDLPLSESLLQVIQAEDHRLLLEVNTERLALDALLSTLMRRVHILDMTISDPPMETIIAAIYRNAAAESAPAPSISIHSGK